MVEQITIRPLTADDIFPVCKIVSTLGADAIKTCLESDYIKNAVQGDNANDESVGIAVAAQALAVILGNLEACRNDLYGFLASLSGIPQETIHRIPPGKLVRMIKQIIYREDFRDFFTEVCELLWPGKSDSSTSFSDDTQTL